MDVFFASSGVLRALSLQALAHKARSSLTKSPKLGAQLVNSQEGPVTFPRRERVVRDRLCTHCAAAIPNWFRALGTTSAAVEQMGK